MEKKLVGNYTRMLWTILSKSWRQHPEKQQLYGHLPPITKTIEIKRTRHTGHCFRSKDELISEVLLLIPSCGRAKVGRPARTNIQQLWADTGYSLENIPGAMDDRDGWRERVERSMLPEWHDDDDDFPVLILGKKSPLILIIWSEYWAVKEKGCVSKLLLLYLLLNKTPLSKQFLS